MKIIESPQGTHLTIGSRSYLNLCSNNYLGLASDPKVKRAAKKAIDQFGVGTASVRALVGTNSLHVELERALAAFKGTEDAVVLTGGYIANLAAVQTFFGKDDIVISDELNHASIIDAVRLSGVQHKFIYKHNDISDLKRQIAEILAVAKKNEAGVAPKMVIITDGVFSMDGDIAPLSDLVVVAKELGAWLMVDDAHGEGVLGSKGQGIIDHFHLHGQVELEVGTLSKAFGVLGGFIAGNKEICDTVRSKSRQFLFSNALSIPDTAALIEGVKILEASPKRVKKLWSNAKVLKKGLKKAGFDIGHSETPITPVMVGDEELAVQFSEALFQEGILVSAIKFPMVAKGKARLRLIPSALHSKSDMEHAVETITKVGKLLKVI